MRYTAVIFAAVFIRCCLSLDANDFVGCEASTICSQNRGKINFDWWQMNYYERQTFTGQTYVIQPDTNTKSNIMIAFKNFNVIGDIYLGIPSGHQILWRKLTWDFGKTFEYSYRDVTSLSIYVPGDERGSFEAFFYVGCEVLTTSLGEMSFPSADDFNFNDGRCWVVEPFGIRDLSRLYFTFRDVYLKKGSRITVTDVHTDREVASIVGSSQYDIFETNMRGQETFLIELSCSERSEQCSSFGNIFSMSYYSLSRREVACVEIKRQCAMGATKLPTAMCEQRCPKLNQILQEELRKEGPVINQQAPIVKSGIPMRARLMRHLSKKVNETQEQKRLQKEKEEKERKEREEKERKEREEKERLEKEKREREEAEQASQDDNQAERSWNCQLPDEYCNCMNNMTEIKTYCFSRRACNTFKDCEMGCMIARVFVCAKVTSSARIELFGG